MELVFGWVGNPETEIGLFENETEIGLFEIWKGCVSTENMSFRMANSNKQFLFMFFFSVKGLEFRVESLEGCSFFMVLCPVITYDAQFKFFSYAARTF